MMKKKILSVASFLAAVLFFLWLASFAGFLQNVQAYALETAQASQQETDAIVVLTGGSERTNTGLDLLRANKAKKILVSGVFPSVDAKSFGAARALPEELADCCVVLGHAAEDTRGNALETRDFMTAEGFSSLRLVTAHYHMPRSLLLFRAVLPQTVIVPHPVSPPSLDVFTWWRDPHTFTLLLWEHAKYLWAQVRVMGGWL